MRWQRPIAEEAALIRLVTDTEEQTRFKVNSINRLRNTILYAEKVRQEWEAKANAVLSSAPEDTWAPNSSPFDSPMLQPLQDSPMRKDSLDFPPSDHLHGQSSHSFFPVSPLLSPEDVAFNRLGSPIGPTASLVSSPRIPAGVPAFRTKASSIKDFKILKPISKGACKFSRLSSSQYLIFFSIFNSWICLPGKKDHHRRLLRDKSTQEERHDCQESSDKCQGRANDTYDTNGIGLRRQTLLYFPEQRLLVPCDGIFERW